MCGRYQLQLSSTLLASARPNTTWRTGHDIRHTPRQQIRPTDSAPVLVASTPGCAKIVKGVADNTTSGTPSLRTEIVTMKWGFTNPANKMPLINARSETIQALPTFRNLLPGQRCAVPLSGFYEWQKSPPPGKQTLTPYLVVSDEQRNSQSAAGAMTEKGTEQAQPQHRVAYLAGVFRQRRGDDGESDPMFVILTAAASDSFRWLHARQPVFLTSDEALLSWLDLSVPVEQAMVTVGCGQQFQHKLHCTRMLKDLSAPAPPAKAMKQKGIASFFSKSQQPGHKDKSKLTMNRTAGAIAAGPAALKAVRTIDKNNNKPPKSVQDNTTKSGSTVSPAKKPLQTKGAGRVFPKTDSKPTKK